MAVKVYTPGQFYAAGGVVEEMFYQEVGKTKKYLRKRVGFVRSFEQVIKNLKDEAWRKFHYMKANVRGVDYTLVYDPDNKEYLLINTTAWNNIKGKRGQYLSDLFCVITFTTFGLVL